MRQWQLQVLHIKNKLITKPFYCRFNASEVESTLFNFLLNRLTDKFVSHLIVMYSTVGMSLID